MKTVPSSSNMIFVFGSNKAGIHGAGAALYARKFHGAIKGKGEGLYGDSYALPTKGFKIEHLPLSEVAKSVERFVSFAKEHPELKFQVTQVACGLAGFRASQIAPLFKGSPENCYFDRAWAAYLGNHYNYWV